MLSRTNIMNKIVPVIFILLIAGLFIFTANDSFAATVRLASITGIEVPTRVAVDAEGNIYVTEPSKNRLQIFNRHGALVDTINGLRGPLGVAVDGAGRIYIGNDGADNVGVYSSDHTLIYKLGKGDGEFKTPNSIAVTSSGMIYVSDSKDNLIKAYNPDGSPALSFGGFGSGSGQFNSPLGLAIDETAGELYVTDLGIFIDPQNGPTSGARVQVFDLNGAFKRSFGEYGTGDGKLIRPLGIALDATGKAYITDSFQGVAQAFDSTGNWIETLYDLENPMKTPIGIAIGKDGRIFIASLNTPSVEIYGLSDYTFLTVTPVDLTYRTQAGINPDPQTINIGNTGTGSLDWSITTSASWITVDQSTGTAGPSGASAVSAGIKADGLGVGTHTGTITVTSPGATETVGVTLEVLPPAVLEVSPSDLSFEGQENGPQPSSQTATIAISNDITGKAAWSASSSALWLAAGPSSGSSVATTVSVSANTTGLTAGTYSGSITITSAGATGSPAAIGVRLTVTSAGGINVTTNLQEASFSITPIGIGAKYQGTGLSWSETNAPAGQYTITFNKVAGYRTPASQTFTVTSGKSSTITGQYKDLRASKKIIAGPGALNSNPAHIRVLNTDGTKGGADFIAFTLKYGVRVAAGDINGDGTDEIIAGAGDEFVNPARIKVFNADGTAVAGADFLAFTTKYGANVTSADLDGDGRAEIIAGTGRGNSTNVRVFTYDGSVVADTGIDFVSDSTADGVKVAAGDIDGDGNNEIITAAGAKNSQTIKVWKVDTASGAGNWTVTEDRNFRAFASNKGIVIATGDLNGDGTDEIIAGEATGANVKVFKGDGTPYGVGFSMSNGTSYGAGFSVSNTSGVVGIAAGDTDSDGVAEIIIGTDTNRNTPGEIKVYKADGSLLNSFKPFNYKGGVNVGLGNFE